MHEAQMHKANSFITLTYDDEHYQPGLEYTHFQRFMYRVRRKNGPTRFFAAGEYGSTTQRPHWHAILFGMAFPLTQQIAEKLYRSELLEQLWPYGYSTVGAVTKQSAAYVAKYSVKRINGARANQHYRRYDPRTGEIINVPPEVAHMSLRPGIGEPWLRKYWKDVYAARDAVTEQGGKQLRPPRYYDKKMLEINSDTIESKEPTRIERNNPTENTEKRLKEREIYTLQMAKRKETKL